MSDVLPSNYVAIRDGLVHALAAAQAQALGQVNQLRNVAYWLVGRALVELQPGDASGRYRARVIEQMSRDLRERFPGSTGYSPTDLKYARALAATLPEIGPQLGTDLPGHPVMRLPWGHIKQLLDKYRGDREALDWYAAQALAEGWSRAVLGAQIATAAHQRAGKALTNVHDVAPDAASDLVAGMGKDPLIFDWLPLGSRLRERQLEAALVGQLARLMTELGRGFLWAGRQRRLVLTDPETGQEKEFFLDLLFYHKASRRWLVIDLKVNEFEFADAMQVALYTRIVDDQLRDQYDEPTVGMVLCPSRHRPLVETALSALTTPTFVTTYLLGPAQVPREELPEAVREGLPDQDDIDQALAAVLAQADVADR